MKIMFNVQHPAWVHQFHHILETEAAQGNEILTLVSWLEMVDNPRQDVPLLAAMNSPIGGFDEEELAEIRLYDRENDYYCALKAAAEQLPKAAEFLNRLNELRLLAVDLPVRQLLWHIVDITGAMGIFGAMPNGRARQHHITALIELAGSFERDVCGAHAAGLIPFWLNVSGAKAPKVNFPYKELHSLKEIL